MARVLQWLDLATLQKYTAIVALIFLTTGLEPQRIAGLNPVCEQVSAAMCSPKNNGIETAAGKNRRLISDLPAAFGRTGWMYNSTTFPNFAHDLTPDDVTESLRHLHPMLATECSKLVRTFLCSVYSPVCTEFGVVPPCRELCETVLHDCAATIQAFGIKWPDGVRCSLFPSYDSAEDDVTSEISLVEGIADSRNNDGIVVQRTASLIWAEELAAGGKICIPPVEDDIIGPQLKLLSANFHLQTTQKNTSEVLGTKANHSFGMWCPAEMRSPPGRSGYSFLAMQNCSPPCPNMYLSEAELSGVRYVIFVTSLLCIVVTCFTLCTFLIDRRRFRYPERPIVYYALSYFAVSLVFMLGFALKEKVSCNEEIRDFQTHDIIQGFTVVKGDHKQACTLIFMVLYYFTVSGTIWWLILTVTWLLAAGFKWGTEAIEEHSLYYHALAWGVPAVQTVAVVTFGKIEGDNIAGVCFLGLYDSEGLRYMLLAPLFVYLLFGIAVLCLGFCCLNRVRIKLRGDEANKTKLAKFMLRIGVFSVMYILPQTIILIIYVIEDSHGTQWDATWFFSTCEDYRVPCPADGTNVTVSSSHGNQKPPVLLFYAKYVLTLVVALPPLFWVMSKKTMRSWKEACCRSGKPRQNRGFRSPSITATHNSNHSRRTSSRKALLQEETSAHSVQNRTQFLGDGKANDFETTAEVRGSSASLLAQTREAKVQNSRQSNVVQRDTKLRLPATAPPIGNENNPVNKRFQQTRIAFTAFTSPHMASSMNRPSSSKTSLASDKREKARKTSSTDLRTSPFNRTELKCRMVRDTTLSPSPLEKNVGNRLRSSPASEHRHTSSMTSQEHASSRSNLKSLTPDGISPSER